MQGCTTLGKAPNPPEYQKVDNGKPAGTGAHSYSVGHATGGSKEAAKFMTANKRRACIPVFAGNEIPAPRQAVVAAALCHMLFGKRPGTMYPIRLPTNTRKRLEKRTHVTPDLPSRQNPSRSGGARFQSSGMPIKSGIS
jgi:hypothetical protein